MKAFLHRLHIGGSKDKDKDKEKDKSKSVPTPLHSERFPPLRQWPPLEEPQRAISTASYNSYKPLPEIAPSQPSTQVTSRPSPVDDEPKLQEQAPSTSFSPPPLAPTNSILTTSRTPSASSQTPSNPTQPSSQAVDDAQSRLEQDSAPRSSRKPTNGSANTTATADVQKKVAFISPPPTPVNLDRPLPDAPPVPTPSGQNNALLKTNVSRFQAAHGKEPRGPLSAAASSSRTDIAVKATTTKPNSSRAASPSFNRNMETPIPGSIRSGTPYSQMSQGSGSRILAASSWSEVTEEDLVSNIGSRERTRQEVLFEIISSEERYVQELAKMKDTFIDPLLHPFSVNTISTTPLASTPNLDYHDFYRSDSPVDSVDHAEHLPPIAARFMSPTPTSPFPGSKPASVRYKDTPNIDGESMETEDDDEGDDQLGRSYSSRAGASSHSHPRSPYRQGLRGRSAPTVPFPSRSHHSLPPAPRNIPTTGSTQSLGRQSIIENPRERNYSQTQSINPKEPQQKPSMLRKQNKGQTSAEAVFGSGIAPHQLPEDLRICLEVIDSGVFDGHKRLSEALKKRYDDQYPLVRSLADVFVSNSDIFQGYATYVLHLERALEQVDDALSNVTTKKPKKQDAAEWQKVCKVLQRLEESAGEKGETGLAITLSKPFQRLLKYPLLFQNLLFHTDPSTFEYESTLQMVAEVETIVRSIEDEKIQKEERDKTRDVFARIEGLDKVRQLALPKPSRVLLEERIYMQPGNSNPLSAAMKGPGPPPSAIGGKGVRGKSSLKRLSDVLQGGTGFGSKKDLWLVVFNDVVLQCQRTGTTSLPLVSSTTSRTNSLPEMQGKAKYATTGRRHSQTKPRNLYKFIKIETWNIEEIVKAREGVVSMEDVARTRATQRVQPRIVPMPEDDGDKDADSDDSDRKSKMSFSYWGADKITVQKPLIKGRPGSQSRRGGINASSYGRESSANAKFGTRLVAGEGSSSPRPASRRAATTPIARRPPQSEDSHNYSRATITQSSWSTSNRGVSAPQAKRMRNTSQNSAVRATTTPPSMNSMLTNSPSKGLASPAPSEDSGVGLYRQMMAKDPLLNNV